MREASSCSTSCCLERQSVLIDNDKSVPNERLMTRATLIPGTQARGRSWRLPRSTCGAGCPSPSSSSTTTTGCTRATGASPTTPRCRITRRGAGRTRRPWRSSWPRWVSHARLQTTLQGCVLTTPLVVAGIKCAVSVWPDVETQSINYANMSSRGLLIRGQDGQSKPSVQVRRV